MGYKDYEKVANKVAIKVRGQLENFRVDANELTVAMKSSKLGMEKLEIL